jgi:hypothetical protein
MWSEVSWDSTVSIVTCYGLDDLGIKLQWEARLSTNTHTGPGGPHSLLYDGYQISFPKVKQPGCGTDHPPTSSAKVNERAQLYLWSPSGPSWPVIG